MLQLPEYPHDATICLPASLAAARALRDSVDRFEDAPAGPGRRVAWSSARDLTRRFLADFADWVDALTRDDFRLLHDTALRSLPGDVTRELNPLSCLLAFVLEVAAADRPGDVPGARVFDLSTFESSCN